MKWYWKCMLSIVGVLGIFISCVGCLYAQGTVADTLENSMLSAVDPIKAIVATVIMFGIGVFAYVKRNMNYKYRKKI